VFFVDTNSFAEDAKETMVSPWHFCLEIKMFDPVKTYRAFRRLRRRDQMFFALMYFITFTLYLYVFGILFGFI